MTKSNNKGFALLIGVMIAATLISIAYSLFSITLKQTTLAVAGKDSQKALYVADTGLECALYADQKVESAFVDASALPAVLQAPQSVPSFNCNNVPHTTITTSNGTVDSYSAIVSKFNLNAFNASDHSCASITISKYLNNAHELKTRIESRGYNTCNTADPQRLERGLEVNY